MSIRLGQKTHAKPAIMLKKLFSILTPRERLQAALLFIASLATAFSQAIGVFSVFPFINVVMNPEIIQETRWLLFAFERGNFSDTYSFIQYLGAGVFLAVLFSSFMSAITMWAKTKFVMGKNHTLSFRLLKEYLSKPYSYFLMKNSSELAKNILAEVKQLTDDLLMAVFDIMINSLLLLIIVGMLMMVNLPVTIGSLLFVCGVYFSVNRYLKVKLKKKGFQRLEANKERFRMANEALSSIKTTKVMGIEEYFLNGYSLNSRRFARFNTYAKVVGQLPYFLLETIVFGGIVFFIIFMLSRGEGITEIIPLVSLFAFAGKRILPAIQKLYISVTQIYFNQPILDKIYEDMVEQGAGQIKWNTESIPGRSGQVMDELPFTKHIALQAIRFRYEDSDSDVIKHINLTIPKNSVTGFAGATGSGKTTLVDIIMGLLEPQQGKLLLDHTPITNENIRLWQKKIGYVPQEIYLSDDTIRKNIAFGVIDKEIKDEQVQFAAKLAALDDFIQQHLPLKYETIIGERGVRLSGGQRQRIGLARALYQNPEVLVLDEATSSLDGTTEETVLKAIEKASETRTVIMIAHRLNTLKECDLIYLLDEGQIIGQGTYEKLMETDQRFQSMAKVSR
ncbi:MAG: ABC transporter ATP-binding protein [Bacillota bacterium]|nr:ABC transporter ATP-binding protein [Bacillota bacterium]MDW7676580.1 ABC transporter ATP-binding protein [Bacillota bacterium]